MCKAILFSHFSLLNIPEVSAQCRYGKCSSLRSCLLRFSALSAYSKNYFGAFCLYFYLTIQLLLLSSSQKTINYCIYTTVVRTDLSNCTKPSTKNHSVASTGTVLRFNLCLKFNIHSHPFFNCYFITWK